MTDCEMFAFKAGCEEFFFCIDDLYRLHCELFLAIFRERPHQSVETHHSFRPVQSSDLDEHISSGYRYL